MTAFEAKHKAYEDRFEALNTSMAGREQSRSDREKAIGLKEKMNMLRNEITGCEHAIMAIREGIARVIWS